VPGPRNAACAHGKRTAVRPDLWLKDLFDIAGGLTTYGHPDWASTHGVAAATAPVVMALLQAGAELVGKTKTQELAYA